MMIKRDQWKKDISILVDVDDKNCLAQLTVALKLNHGVRQWLYIIAGVLFPACRQAGFVLSFAQAKESI
jgi:hypothetical protein